MTAEVLFGLLRVNLAVAAAVLVLALIRTPVRRLCGPDVAYCLWFLAPWFGLAQLVAWLGTSDPAAFEVGEGIASVLVLLWLAGAAVSLAVLVLGQRRVLRNARSGRMGPAVVGILQPRVFFPSDFDARFSPAEQKIIRAHERAHLLRHDVLANAALAISRCFLWFNPFVHLAAGLMRQDQEMACDATVLEERPEQRRRYAATLLKTQLAHDKGLGTACAWLGAHPLETRIRAVALGAPDPFWRISGTLLLAFVGIGLTLIYADDSVLLFRDLASLRLARPSY